MGHEVIETPHLDKLASESAVFRRGYVGAALQTVANDPATGLYSHQNRTTGNDPAATPANQNHASTENKNIRELLISHRSNRFTQSGSQSRVTLVIKVENGGRVHINVAVSLRA